eukprot:COSAG06_NODE_31657_length_517_cov_19.169856_1_plen_86_part_00
MQRYGERHGHATDSDAEAEAVAVACVWEGGYPCDRVYPRRCRTSFGATVFKQTFAKTNILTLGSRENTKEYRFLAGVILGRTTNV